MKKNPKCFDYIYFSSITGFDKAVKMVFCHLFSMYSLLKALALTNENYQKISLVTYGNKAYARAIGLVVCFSVCWSFP